MTPSSREQAFEGRSPREHRAYVEWQHPTNATDSSADESLEVERPVESGHVDTLRLRSAEARQEEPANNGEKATTAVARAIRSIHAPDKTPEPGPPGNGRRSGVRLKSTVDAEQLLTREKLRRVERHWERSKRDEREPRRQCEQGPPGSGEPGDMVGGRNLEGSPLGVQPEGDRKPRHSPALAGGRVRRRETTRTTGNMANPRIGSRVQQTCKVPGGANRRSREERQGRNESGTWQPRAEVGSASPGEFPREDARWQLFGAAKPTGVDTRRRCRWRGGTLTTP
jgi:hypothetical protein